MSLNILLVDDEDDILSVLKEFIEILDQNVFIAESGEDAIKKCMDNKIDIMITDFEMPDINGFQLAKKVINIDSNIDIYLLSGYAKILGEEDLAASGIKRVLDKPFKIEDIEKIIEKKLDEK